ncbi:exocyst complex component Sec5-domain-containing protein [Xylaria intraflava]|nr:exocyst complex component Sec5-domain-containing protein [Xylaria intraflava]
MADLDRDVLDFYGISSMLPTTWPSEKNDKSDDSDSEREQQQQQHRQQKQQQKKKINRRKSRYDALERAVGNRSSIVAGSEISASGVSNLVQKDEPDPLGTSDSVVGTLKGLGVPVQNDTRLRNRFLLSSTSFSPALFLSQMHANADTQSLLSGLDVLSRSIDQKSASLKVLVESNFERFVRAKATIDNVYREMKYQGAEPSPAPNSHARAHSRHTSRGHYKGNIGGGPSLRTKPSISSAVGDSKKKNALLKESDYGVLGIKGPLLDVSAKAEDVWGPALGGRDKEENLRVVSTCLDRHKEYIETSANIADSIRRKDYDTLVEEYGRARKFSEETKELVESLGSTTPSDEQAQQILIAARMWYDVEDQLQLFKRELWRKLTVLHNAPRTDTRGSAQDQQMEVISLLLELGAEDNPIWVWLLSRYEFLKDRIASVGDRTKIEIEVLRRRLASAETPSPQILASYLRSLGRHPAGSKPNGLDTSDVIELWEKMLSFLSSLLSTQGVLGEVLEFWQTVENFMNGKAQKTLPTGYNGESREHHRLSTQGTLDLRKATIELVDMIRAHVYEFFASAPPEDVSLLFSPLPPSPVTPLTAQLSPTNGRDPRFHFDANNPPPLSPMRGEAWEKFAFWPPISNSVSGVYYLSKMLGLVGTGATEMASVAPVSQDDAKQMDLLRNLVSVARERCVGAISSAWIKDSENIKLVEDWQRSKEMGDVTCMPATFAAFEGAVLGGLQKILFVSEAIAKTGPGDIILPPPKKLLASVRTHYVNTLYRALSGMVENAEAVVKKAEDEWTTAMDAPMGSDAERALVIAGKGMMDTDDTNVRMLLTLSNLQALRSQVIPNLNSQFESAFSIKLTDESKTIKDVSSQIDARLFQSYTRPAVESLRNIIRTSLDEPDLMPMTKPTEARSYVYQVLLSLVLIHTQVSTTAPSLTSQVLSYLLEQVSRELLEVFKSRPKYDLGTLMQATLDVEFIAHALSYYTTEKASAVQGEIYSVLDARTDNESRSQLQNELPGMRELLKRLREQSKTEFACFKKVRRTQTMERTATG